jgi:hypothetical protein
LSAQPGQRTEGIVGAAAPLAWARSLTSLTSWAERWREDTSARGASRAVRLSTELEQAERGLLTRRMLLARAAIHDTKLRDPTLELARRTLVELEHRESKRRARARSLAAHVAALDQELAARRAAWVQAAAELAAAQRVVDEQVARAGVVVTVVDDAADQPGDAHAVVPPAELSDAAARVRRDRILCAKLMEGELRGLEERLREGRELAASARAAVLAVAGERHAMFRTLGEYLDGARPSGLGPRLGSVDDQHRLIARLGREVAALAGVRARRRRQRAVVAVVAAVALAVAVAAGWLGS